MENYDKPFAGGIPAGVPVRAGNFTLTKVSRRLNKKQRADITAEVLQGMTGRALSAARDYIKGLDPGGLPFMRVETLSGGWSLELAWGTGMYAAIDGFVADADGHLEPEDEEALARLFSLMFTDTCVVGDAQYIRGKLDLLWGSDGLLRRLADAPRKDEEDRKALDGVLSDEERKETVRRMADGLPGA